MRGTLSTVLNVSKLLQKKFPKKAKNKKRRINTQEQVTAKVTKKLTGTTYMLEKEELVYFVWKSANNLVQQ